MKLSIAQRVINLTTALVAAHNTGTKISPSQLAKEQRLSSYVINALTDLHYMKIMSDGVRHTDKKQIVWLPTETLKNKDIDRIIKETQKLQREIAEKAKTKKINTLSTKPAIIAKSTSSNTTEPCPMLIPKEIKIKFNGCTMLVPANAGITKVDINGSTIEIELV